MPLVPSFRIKLEDQILQGLATVGKFDGKNPCLTCATSGGRIFVYDPYSRRDEQDTPKVRYLNINKKITAVASGRLDPNLGRDMLLVGTAADVLAYDVEENRDVFFKEVPEGVSAMVCGRVGGHDQQPLAVVGGSCNITGYDAEGEERFWTVTGDNVRAMALADVTGDGSNELLVGSDDYEIRVFANDNAISEVTEAEKVVGLAHLSGSRFGYALENGTVGVYEGKKRRWRIKSKNRVTAFSAFDLTGDGRMEICVGWSNGKLEVRNEETGEVVYKDTFKSPISALLRADYRQDGGGDDMICCSLEGEVRGYKTQGALGGAGALKDDEFMDENVKEETLVELNQKRQDLLAELKGYERNTRALYSAGVGGETETTGTIPKDTKVNSSLEMNPEEGCGELVLSTNNDTVIKAAILFSEEIFEEEARFVYFPNPQRDAKVAIKPKKDSAADVAIKVLVSSRTSSTYHVFEVEFRLPRFCMYVQLKALPQAPASSVQVRIAERIVKIARWIDDAFMLQTSREVDDYSEECGCHMVCLRESKPLSIRAVNAGDEGCDVLVQCDDMDTCGEVIQDMTKALGLGDVECTADFPYDMERLRETLTRVDEHNALRSRLVTDVADASITIKHLVIRAEDSRILQDWKTMKRMYGELRDLNRELIVEHQKRVENHEALLAALRDVNQTIQKAGKLRAGGPKTRMVAACRQAIKVNNVHALFKIIQLGADLAEQTSGFE